MKVKGVVVCSAGSVHLAFFPCWGAGLGSLEVLAHTPWRVASSSGVGVLGSSSTRPNREASITSSLSMVIKGTIHC